MKKLLALIHARNLEFYRDRSALVWTLLFPFIVLAGFTYGYSGKKEALLNIRASGPGLTESSLIKKFRSTPGMDFQITTDEPAAIKKLSRYETDLVLKADESGKKFTYSLNPDSDRGKLAERLLQAAVEADSNPRAELVMVEVTGHKIRYADWLLPGLLAMNIMFGSMFGVGYVIVRYRKNGVLKRLRATPLSAFQFLLAQVVSRMTLMVATATLVVGGAMVMIGFHPANGVAGTIIDLLLFLAVSSAAMISVGLVVAAQISSEEVADGVLNLMTWPMIFLSGIWFSLDGASPWVIRISRMMPLTHVVKGLRAILIDGAHFSDLMPEVGILLVITAVLVTIGSALFKWR
ncbi:MAG: ABC transporter permease [Cryobacterium sp.]|nr:ABC transporter permease [Oligoflexia bacterium]